MTSVEDVVNANVVDDNLRAAELRPLVPGEALPMSPGEGRPPATPADEPEGRG